MSKTQIQNIERIKDFWNSRAPQGTRAGSDDVIAKAIEIRAISKYVSDGMDVLEMGCGNGMTAVDLAKRFKINLLGLDYAKHMIREAIALSEKEKLKGTVSFDIADISAEPEIQKRFDLIYTERVLINLSNWQEQKKAIEYLTGLLKPSGLYIMCENSRNGLNRINQIRKKVGLAPINPPWHNVYFQSSHLTTLSIPNVTLEAVDNYSSTYYFLSRVVNAWFANLKGKAPDYNALVNRLALLLPAIGNFAQGRIWVWRKTRN